MMPLQLDCRLSNLSFFHEHKLSFLIKVDLLLCYFRIHFLPYFFEIVNRSNELFSYPLICSKLVFLACTKPWFNAFPSALIWLHQKTWVFWLCMLHLFVGRLIHSDRYISESWASSCWCEWIPTPVSTQLRGSTQHGKILMIFTDYHHPPKVSLPY